MTNASLAPLIDGPLWNLHAARASQQLSVRGMKIRVDPDELKQIVRQLHEVAQDVAAIVATTERVVLDIEYSSAESPATGVPAATAAREQLERVRHLEEVIERLRERTDSAWWAYREAERAATRHLLQVVPAPEPGRPPLTVDPFNFIAATGQLIGRLGMLTLATLAEARAQGRWHPGDAQTSYAVRESTSAMLHYLGIDPGDDPVGRFGSLIIPSLTGGISRTVRATVVPAPSPAVYQGGGIAALPYPPGHPPPTHTVEGIVHNAGNLNSSRDLVEPGTIRVDRMVAPDGTVAWQVYVPPTQGHPIDDFGGPSPTDWASNLQTFNREDSAAIAGVVAAMRIAGVRSGEPVLMAGHSQGGLVAAEMASRPEIQAQFSIESVVTIGSPVARVDLDDSVVALHLEHSDDPVSGVDGTTNPIGPNQLTAVRDTSHDGPESGLITPYQSHDTPNFEETGRQVDASGDAAIRNWFEASAAMLDSRARVTSTYVQTTREP